MRERQVRAIVPFVICAAFALLTSAAVSGQIVDPGKRRLPAPPPGRPMPAVAGDKVEITDFAVEPAQPEPGQSVTVRMTVRNKTDAPLPQVPWRIEYNSQVLRSGVEDGVAAGASFEVRATLASTAEGAQELAGYADPDNTLNEPVKARGNNVKSVNLSASYAADLAAADVNVTPQAPLVVGRKAEVKIKIQNLSGAAAQNVRWRVKAGDSVIKEGRGGVDARQSFETSFPWTPAQEGSYDLSLEVDPDNSAGEPASNRGNNQTSKGVTVAGAEERLLGNVPNRTTQFGHSDVAVPPGCAELRPDPAFTDIGAQTSLDCSLGPAGVKADFEYWKGVTLQNGWVVKKFSVEIHDASPGDATASNDAHGFSVLTQPSVGSPSPYTKLHLWVEGRSKAHFYVTVKIEGPRGTNPFGEGQ